MITGSCRCGEVEYLCRENPGFVNICHCLDCQKSSGASFMTWASFVRDEVTWVDGRPKEINTSQDVYRGFCGHCGTNLYWRHAAQPSMIDLSVGSFDHPLPHKPQAELFTSRKLPWVTLNPNIPHYEQRTTLVTKTPEVEYE